MKVCIHTDFGGFRLSEKAAAWVASRGLDPEEIIWDMGDPEIRTHPVLIEVIELMGDEAGDNLKVVEIPDGVKWHIYNYDGLEHVAENHRRWS